MCEALDVLMFYGHDLYCKTFSGVYFYKERNARLSIFTSLYFPNPFASSRVGRISEIRTEKVHKSVFSSMNVLNTLTKWLNMLLIIHSVGAVDAFI